MTLQLSPQLIEMAKKEIEITQYYEPSEICTANHILFKEFIEKTKWKGVPKIIYYIVMNETYGQPEHKDENGNLGYKLKFKQ
jgi:hypothetical protein